MRIKPHADLIATEPLSMSVPIVQIQYQQLEQLAQRFAKQQTQVQAILQSLRQTIQALEHGGWMGDAATACFKEFHAEIVPAYCKLQHVFSESQTSLNQIAQLFHEAEAEAAGLFRGEMAQAVGNASPWQILNHLETNLSEQLSRFQPETLEHMLGAIDPQSFDITTVLALIENASLVERQAILQNPEVLNLIRASAGDQAYIVMAVLSIGSFRWLASQQGADGCIAIFLTDPLTHEPRTNNFAQWICTVPNSNEPSSQISPPNPLTGSMNCWEFVLFSAFLGGNITYDELDAVYSEVGTPITLEEHKQAIYTALGGEHSTEWNPCNDIPAGSIIFFDDGSNPIAHVAIATGREINGSPELISLWDRPNTIDSVQFTTIEALNGSDYTINVAPNPWLND